MSTVKANNHQIGQSGTASQNFTLYQPSTPDGTVRLAVGNSGATTGDVLSVSSTGLSVTGTLTSTGVNTFPAGSASAPSITTTGDTNTGVFFPAADTAAITTGGSERMRITSGGNLLVGTTSTSLASATTGTGLQYIPANAVIVAANGGNACLIANKTDNTTGDTVLFRYNGGTVGSISITTSATAYNTSSDYRLKDNPQPLTGSGAFIDALQPKTWEWKADGSRGVGFIAHEAQAVSPSSVVGEKDAVDPDGKPVMQAMEYGSAEFIANIIAELQSLRARVADLEGTQP